MKKFLIVLLALVSLVGVGYCAYTIYDSYATKVVVAETPEVGVFE